jgi:hypothetical protein
MGPLAALVAAGLLSYWLGYPLVEKKGDYSDFWIHFWLLAAAAALIERSVEVYLNIFGLNGEKVLDENRNIASVGKSAKKDASRAALVLGFALSLAGLRLLDSMISPVGGDEVSRALFYAADVLVSAGLMAGGADLFHPLANTLNSFFQAMSNATKVRQLQLESHGTSPNEFAEGTLDLLTNIDDLGLVEPALTGARRLAAKYSQVQFTSGFRSISDQANAMAGNIVKTGNRKWIIKTYLATDLAKQLQDWVDANPAAVTVADLAKGLEEIMSGWPDSDKARLSKHLVGLAFDVKPVEGNSGIQILAYIRTGLPGVDKVLTNESGISVWHVQFA